MKRMRSDGRLCSVVRGMLPMAALLLLSAPAAAQLPLAPAELERLAFLEGEWEGEGWMEYAPGQRGEFRGTERVERRMGGRLVVVEGAFTARMGPDQDVVPVHHALGVFSYDAAADRFVFRAYTAQGANGEAHDAEVGVNEVVWGYEDPRFGTVRYTISLTPQGEWHEVGHASRDGGATWHRFFEMTLQRR